ncbi:hypothetical protein KKD04_02160 [Patescibacteria group bacterium]|nr:hypothetical protein [Patescibacteria group bacterium]
MENIENFEGIEEQIKKLIEELYNFDFESLDENIQDEWYWVEQEANVGKDRIQAKERLVKFVERLKT